MQIEIKDWFGMFQLPTPSFAVGDERLDDETGGRELLLVLLGLHVEDERDDGVDLHIANQPGKEELLQDVRLDGAERGETKQEARESSFVFAMISQL